MEIQDLKIISKELQISVLLLKQEIESLKKFTSVNKKRKLSETEEETEAEVYIVSYKKCYAIFGNTKPIKEILKENFESIFNPNLKDPTKNNKKSPGWIIRKEHLSKLLKKIPEIEDKTSFVYK